MSTKRVKTRDSSDEEQNSEHRKLSCEKLMMMDAAPM